MAVIYKKPVKKHRPVCLLMDRSDSVASDNGRLMEGINRCSIDAVRRLKEQVLYRDMTELLIIHFATEPEIKAEFVKLEELKEEHILIAQTKGCTNTGKALLKALDLLEQKKAECKKKGEEYVQPLLFLITDGYPDPGKLTRADQKEAHARAVAEYQESYARAAARIKEMEQADKLVFVAGGITVDQDLRADMDKLRELTSKPDQVVELDCSGDLSSLADFFEIILQATESRLDRSPIEKWVQKALKGRKADE